ncbi:PadR family transcriptional regulator [Kribbella sp. NPDC050241]|uniref:PadR family transcriptional regulator n=1 Tax=Kribbella sp. NPDC050241 TaxID=3364115 RepID=UPI003788BD05
MSLRHALLAVLTAEPMTGYDLVKYFDGSVAYVWSAPHSQIYPELRRMEGDGLLDVEVVPRGERAEKRLYAVNEAGLAELRRWSLEPVVHPPERDPYRLRAAHFEFASYDAARLQLQEHLSHFTRALRDWEQMVRNVESRQVPLMRKRFSGRPKREHEAIQAFRRFAFRGEVAKAKFEIAWAKEGLAMLSDLEASGAQLWGDSDRKTSRQRKRASSR